jgi:serine/threonine protein kinase
LEKCTNKVDIWALGAILFEMVYLRPVFKNDFDAYTYYTTHQEYVVDANGLTVLRSMTWIDVAGILAEMLHKDPERRPTAECIAQMLTVPGARRHEEDTERHTEGTQTEINRKNAGLRDSETEQKFGKGEEKSRLRRDKGERVRTRRRSCQCIGIAFGRRKTPSVDSTAERSPRGIS